MMIDNFYKERADNQSATAEKRMTDSISSKANPEQSKGVATIKDSRSDSYDSQATARTIALSGSNLSEVIANIKGGDASQSLTTSTEGQFVNDYSDSVQHKYDSYSFSFVIGKNDDYIEPLNTAYELFICGSSQFQEPLRIFFQYENNGIESIELGEVSKDMPLRVDLPYESRICPWIILVCAKSSSELISASQSMMVDDKTCKKFTNYISQIHLIKKG